MLVLFGITGFIRTRELSSKTQVYNSTTRQENTHLQ